MSDVFAPFTLPLRREGDAAIVDANGKTVLVIDPERDIDDDRAVEAIADHVFAMLAAAPAPSSLAGGEVVSDARKITAAAKAICHLFVGHGGDPWTKRSAEDRAHFREEASQVVAALAALSPEAPAREGAHTPEFGTAYVHLSDLLGNDFLHGDYPIAGLKSVSWDDLRAIHAALTPRHEAPTYADELANESLRRRDAEFGRHEAPAEGAGEMAAAVERLTNAADFLEGDCVIVGDHEVRGNDISAVLSALRARSSAPEVREGEAESLFKALRDESWDLRCFSVPTGGDDADIGWRVVGHWQAEPCERTVAEVFYDDPAEAVRQALAALKAEGAK
ncbi:hypothetical protein D3C71_831020 [compost metagenome]